jgi:hypothetical protein
MLWSPPGGQGGQINLKDTERLTAVCSEKPSSWSSPGKYQGETRGVAREQLAVSDDGHCSLRDCFSWLHEVPVFGAEVDENERMPVKRRCPGIEPQTEGLS